MSVLDQCIDLIIYPNAPTPIKQIIKNHLTNESINPFEHVDTLIKYCDNTSIFDFVSVQSLKKPTDNIFYLERSPTGLDMMKELVTTVSSKKIECGNIKRTQFEETKEALFNEFITTTESEIVDKLKEICPPAQVTYSQDAITGDNNIYVGDVHAAMAININRTANIIAQKTRCGAANFVIVSPTVLTILQSATTAAFARDVTPSSKIYSIKRVGTLNHTIKVLVNPYAPDNTPVLAGFCQSFHSGLFFGTHKFIDVNETETSIAFNHMSEFYVRKDAADYYGQINVDTKNLSFI